MRTDLKFVDDVQGGECIYAVEEVTSIPDKREMVFIKEDRYQVVERSFEYIDRHNCIVYIMIRKL